MSKKVLFLSGLVFLLAASLLYPQFLKEETAQWDSIEQFLKTAEIVDSKEIGEGVTRPYRLFLSKDGKEMSGCWKNVRGQYRGYLEGWRYEIAAYRMDRLLGLDMVPPTVEREFDGKTGSLQFWVSGGTSDLDRMEENIPIPEDKMEHWRKCKYLMRAFDSLIANEDRTQQNIRYTDDWRMILIDHSRSFRSAKKFRDQLMYGMNGIRQNLLIRQLPRDFFEKIKQLDFTNVKNAVGPYLRDREIKAVIQRRDLILDEVEAMIKQVGEDQFLYER